jgi:hypothetical protein
VVVLVFDLFYRRGKPFVGGANFAESHHPTHAALLEACIYMLSGNANLSSEDTIRNDKLALFSAYLSESP